MQTLLNKLLRISFHFYAIQRLIKTEANDILCEILLQVSQVAIKFSLRSLSNKDYLTRYH